MQSSYTKNVHSRKHLFFTGGEMLYQTFRKILWEKKKCSHNMKSILLVQNSNLNCVTETFWTHWENLTNWAKKTSNNTVRKQKRN